MGCEYFLIQQVAWIEQQVLSQHQIGRPQSVRQVWVSKMAGKLQVEKEERQKVNAHEEDEDINAETHIRAKKIWHRGRGIETTRHMAHQDNKSRVTY